MSIVKPYTFTAGTKARANEVNANFDTLYSQVNLNISEIANNARDIDDIDTNKADINGSSTQRFAVADAVTGGDAVNKQTMEKAITPLFGYINGLTIIKDSNSPDDTIIVDTGSCYDSTNTVVLKLDNSESVRNENQGANTTYDVYIQKSNNSNISSIVISQTEPDSNLYKFRKIGSYTTDDNNKILTISYYGIGDEDNSPTKTTENIMPDFSRGFTVGQNYKSTVNGWLVWAKNSGNNIRYNIWVAVNGLQVGSCNNGRTDGSSTDHGVVPISVGDTITYDDRGSTTLKVYPCKGWN